MLTKTNSAIKYNHRTNGMFVNNALPCINFTVFPSVVV